MNRILRIKVGVMSALMCVLSQGVLCQNGLPDGKGKVEFVHNCTACHRADMVTRVKKTPEDWRKSVDEMASRGTDGSKEDLDNAYLYLVTNFSKDKSESTSATQLAPHAAISGRSAMLNPSDTELFQWASSESSLLTSSWGRQGFNPPSTLGSPKMPRTEKLRTAMVGMASADTSSSVLARYLVSLPPLH